MKKITVSLVLAFLIGLAAYSQNSNFKVNLGKFSEEYKADESSTNTKVMNNFSRMFSDATNIKWSKDAHNIERVYFEAKGKATRAAFNKKGQFLYSITTYGEQYLPQDVLLRVKENYFGKNIFGVTEVNALGKTAYLIILEDRTSWLHIKVLDDEMTEEKVLLKAK